MPPLLPLLVSEILDMGTVRFPDASGRSLAAFIGDLPDGAVVELAPGRYEGPITLSRPVVLRGAGDLTRIVGPEDGPGLVVDGATAGRIEVASVLVEGGGGIVVRRGDARLFNVHVQRCWSEGGAALAVYGGVCAATKLRVQGVRAEEGGAVFVGGDGRLVLEDSQLEETEARRGGALCLRGGVVARLVGVTIRKSRATSAAGGQAFFLADAEDRTPRLALERVRLEDAPLGLPIVADTLAPPAITIRGCDMPRIVLDTPGVVDEGDNDWR